MTDKTDLKDKTTDMKSNLRTDLKIDLDTLDELLIKNQAEKIKIHTTQNNGKLRGDAQDPTPYYTFYEINGKLFLAPKNTDNYIYRISKINLKRIDEYTTNLEVFTINEKGFVKNIIKDCVATEFDKLNHYINKKHLIPETKEPQPLLLEKNPTYKNSSSKGQTTFADFTTPNLPPKPKALKNNDRPKDETTLDMFFNNNNSNFGKIQDNEVFSSKDPSEIFASNLGINDNKGNISENTIQEYVPENIHEETLPDFANNFTNEDLDLDENSTDFVPDDVFEDEEINLVDDVFEDENFTIPTKNKTQTTQPSTQNNAPQQIKANPQNIAQPVQAQNNLTPNNSPAQTNNNTQTKPSTQTNKNQDNSTEETEPESKPKEKKKREIWKNVGKDAVDVGIQYSTFIVMVLCVAGVFAPFIAGWIAVAAIVVFSLRANIIAKIEGWVKDIAKGVKAEKEKSKEKAKKKAQAKAEKKANKAQKKSAKQSAIATKNAAKSNNKAKNNRVKTTKKGKINKKVKGIETDYSPADTLIAPYAKEYADKDYTPIKDKGFGNELSEEELARQEEIINSTLTEPLMPKNVLPKTHIREEGIDYGTPNFDLDKQTPVKEVKEKDINLPQNREMKCFEEEDTELEEQDQPKTEEQAEQEKPKTEEQERQEIREKTRDLHHGEQLPLNELHKLYGSKIAVKDNPLDLPKAPKQKEEDHSQGM